MEPQDPVIPATKSVNLCNVAHDATEAARIIVADDTADLPAPVAYPDPAPNATDNALDGSIAAAAPLPQDPDADLGATPRLHPRHQQADPLPEKQLSYSRRLEFSDTTISTSGVNHAPPTAAKEAGTGYR